jgi:putative hydrolase of the HAD superfamily
MNTKINTFIFDCFGVICDPVFNAWYRDNMLRRGLKDDNLLNIFTQHDLGKFSEEEVITYFSNLEGITSTKDKIREEIDSYLKLDEELADIILQLKKKGYKTMLLSNADANYFEKKVYVKYPHFKDLFDEIIISSAVGLIKPNKEIYLYTLKEAGVRAEECLFIDDSQTNIDGAEAVGINGFLYKDAESFLKYLEKIEINLNK